MVEPCRSTGTPSTAHAHAAPPADPLHMEINVAGVDVMLSTNGAQLVAAKLLDLFAELSMPSTLPDGHRCDLAVRLTVSDISVRDLQVGFCLYMIRVVVLQHQE